VQLTSIVILAHNQEKLTRACVGSILKQTDVPFELVLVDNGSTDGTPSYFRDLKKRRPNVRVVTNRANLGYAAGMNAGIRASQGAYVCLLNNDTVVTEGWLGRLVAVAESDPSIGCVGPLTNSASGLQDAGDEHYTSAAGLQLWARYVARIHAGRVEEVAPPQRLVGFCLLIKREVIAKVGLLDERFGRGNFEDDDYALRVRLAGYWQVVARDVWIDHRGSATFRALGVDYQALIEENRAKFVEKWQGVKEVAGVGH
jgi:GT2 family glycosyltransferase